jgi:hypothetical protein
MLEDYANIFNKRKLFLRFNGLQKGYIGTKIKDKVLTKHILFNHYFNEYKYHLYSAYYFLEQLEQLENAIMNQYKYLKSSIEFQNEYKIEYDSFIVHEYMLRIMPFLNTMFILQDRLMILIAIFLDIEFKDPIKKPNESDKDYKNKIKKFRNKIQSFTSYATNYLGILEVFPERISELTIKYWKQNGQELRKYRNLEQHQFNLLEEAYIIRIPTERFILYLPDNPNERDFEKLTYHNKIVAIDFFKFEIQVFHDFVEKIMETIGVKPENHEFGSSFSPKTNFTKHYNERDLMKIWVIKNEAILFSVGEKTSDGATAKLNIRKIENKMKVLRWEIK